MMTYTHNQLVNPNSSLAAYRRNQFSHATPQELMLAVYDVGINACARRERSRAKAALIELIDSLNFEYKDVSTGLLRLYSYCLELLGRDDYDQVKNILTELRTTWAQALANQG